MATDIYAREPMLKPAIGLGVALSVALLVSVTHLPFALFAITLLAVLLAQVADGSLGMWFLVGVSLHAVLSYLSIEMAGIISATSSNAYSFVPEAFKVYFVGISAMLIGYGVSRKPDIRWPAISLKFVRFDKWTMGLAIVGSVIVAYVLNGIGFVQMVLTGTFSRYFGEEQVGPGYSLYQSLLRRGLAILVVATPILLLRWQQSKSKALLLMAVVSLLFMLSTVRRGPILMALVSLALSNAVAGKNRRLIAVVLVALVAGFFVLQGFFVNVESESGGALANTAFVLRSASTEVNDLAWVLSEWNRHWFMGATWAAAVWPLPSTISSFKDTYVLTSVTKDIVGIPREAESGGLRISMFGEAYLNFGYAAVIGLGLLVGVLVKKFNGVIDWAKRQGPILLFPCMFLFLAGLCQFYLSGTGTLTDSVLSFLVIAIVYGVSIQDRSALPTG